MSEFLKTSRELIAVQRDVMLSYFGAPVHQPAAVAVASAGAAGTTGVADTAPLAPVLPGAPPEPEPHRHGDVLTTVTGVIAQRTGYPVDMVSPDLDLEADLSIDSIKRTEIAGELVSRLGFGANGGGIEDLTRARTAAAMADVLSRPHRHASALIEVPARYVMKLVDAGSPDEAEPTALVGANIVITGGEQALADEIAGQLSARGAMPFVLGGITELDDSFGRVDGLISLHALEQDGDPVLPGGFPLFRSALRMRPRWVLAAAQAAQVVPRRAAGLRGLFRTLHREYPEVAVRLVELDAAAGHDAVASDLVAELFLPANEPVIVTSAGSRRRFTMVSSSLGTLATIGAGPSGTGPAEAKAIGLTEDSVILLVGGARGITAQVARVLSASSGCRIELAGRTRLPTEPEHPSVAAAGDLPALRGALAKLGDTEPAGIERTAKRILAQREVASTLSELRGLGSEVNYHAVDARDVESIRHLVKEIHAEHGRIDGVIYAAGIVEDRLVVDKDVDSFARVYGTKVDGAAGLLTEIEQLPSRPKFVVFFGSIVAAQGNRGQADYAAANDALDTLGSLSAANNGSRVLTVHWGPWAPTADHGGMISAELSKTYAERGIALVDPDEGVTCLLRELAWGPAGAGSVIYTASGW
ncbi:MAG: SDR family NAD(P)-dependent oxidoreductase [Haloechinothrix sp.]